VNKNLPAWAQNVLCLAGLVLVASMLMVWIDFGDGISGLRLAWNDNHWMFLVPLAGAALFVSASTRSAHARLCAVAAGVVVAGYVLFGVARSFIEMDLDTAMILAGAGLLVAASTTTAMRLAGGALVLVGFFAPWADFSMFDVLVHTGFSVALVLWLIPLAGIAGVLSAGNRLEGGKLAAVSGLAVFGAIVTVLGWFAINVFGIGAWLAFGASAVALVVGLFARWTPTPTDDDVGAVSPLR
jgi:hypothetical protein